MVAEENSRYISQNQRSTWFFHRPENINSVEDIATLLSMKSCLNLFIGNKEEVPNGSANRRQGWLSWLSHWSDRRFNLGPDPRPLWLLVGTPSACGPELAYRLRVAQPTLMDVYTYYFWYTIILLYMFVWHILLPLRFGWLLVLSLYKEDYFSNC